jgi:hypothetical protein
MQAMNSIRRVMIVGIAFGFGLAGQAQQPPKASPKQAGNDSVHTIVLPQYTPEIPGGPHLDTYRKECLICHSARYVAMQPRFPQGVWEKEVKKMVDAYGATISNAEQKEIVEYLVAVKGVPESK